VFERRTLQKAKALWIFRDVADFAVLSDVVFELNSVETDEH
jgi:hypothetical protein